MGTQRQPAAPVAVAEAEQTQEQQYLTFTLRGEIYALPILGVKEIIEYHHVTTVPMMPAFIRGVINLRGAVVPVVDLAARFGRPSSANTKRTCIVIVETHADGDTQDIGVVVDQVNAAIEIAPGDIEPPPAFGANIRTEFISGMGKVADRFVIILNSDQLLSLQELETIGALSDGVAPETVEQIGAGSADN